MNPPCLELLLLLLLLLEVVVVVVVEVLLPFAFLVVVVRLLVVDGAALEAVTPPRVAPAAAAAAADARDAAVLCCSPLRRADMCSMLRSTRSSAAVSRSSWNSVSIICRHRSETCCSSSKSPSASEYSRLRCCARKQKKS